MDNPFFSTLLILAAFVGMGAHVFATVRADWLTMLIAGVIFPPVGIVHGWGVMLGIWG